MFLKYNDSDENYAINSFSKRGNVVTVRGDSLPENTSGFKIILNGKVIEDCSDFITRYDTLGNLPGIAYSNDDSTETEENPLVREMSEEAILAALADLKSDKIVKSKTLLSEYLESHPLTSTAHGGKEGVYSVTAEKQTLMMSQYMTYQLAKEVNPDAKLTWNESGEECEEWTEAEFLQLIMEVKQYVYPLVSYQQGVEKAINSCITQEELDAIEINYSEVLL